MGHYDQLYEEEARKINKGLRRDAKRDLENSLKSFIDNATPQDMWDAVMILEEWKHVKAFAKICRSLGRNS